MRNTAYCLLCIFLLAFFHGCKIDFDPVVAGSYNNLMVFMVLDNRNNSQEAVVQKSFQTLEERNKINNCELLLVENDTGYYRLRDTAINDDQFAHYYLPDYKLKRGAKYEVLVLRDSIIQDRASVSTQLLPLSNGSIYRIEFGDLKQFDGTDPLIRATINFNKPFINSPNNCYYIFKSFVEYEIIKDGKSSIEYNEIYPYVTFGSSNDVMPGGSQVWKWSKDSFAPGKALEFTKSKISSFTYSGYALVFALQFLSKTFDHKDVTIKRLLSVVYTIDAKFFDTYIYSSWDEQISSRFDLRYTSPDIFTKSNGINGFFGAISADTISFNIPQDIIDIWGYNNGQK